MIWVGRNRGDFMEPHIFLKKSIKYDRKASVNWLYNHKIKAKFYQWLSEYYERRWEKIKCSLTQDGEEESLLNS